MDRPDAEEFNFYDGPPFATGKPHYWHILAGTIKDVIPRYQTMLWKKVSRRFGWDTHGLPIENIVEKKMWISWKDDIEKMWVHAFNEECRANVFGYVDEWKKTVNRMWRWVDMENDYKTMDTSFMQSVWWVFKAIYDKGLIYEWNRIVPYCPRCTTPLSNFEVNQGYKDKQDKTATVKFKVKGNDSKYILAWTTTPWTLVANLGLAVWAEVLYSEILDKATGETYVLASDLVKNYYKQPKNGTGTENWKDELKVPVPETDDYKIIREYKGSCLAGIKYEPIFDDFEVKLNGMWENLGTGIELWENAFSVVIGHHVTTESGTWIVHIAPAYWEDDNLIGKNERLGFVAHIDDSGKTYNLLENNWVEIGEFNELILTKLKDSKTAILINTINHSYPHCWRCDTPLIYRAISAWYVSVEKIRDKMVENNKKTNWTPEIIRDWRFGKWLEWARDWNISRNRYWGSAMPVWQSEDKKSEVCIWSIEELYQANKEYGQIEKKEKITFNNNFYISRHWISENNELWIESCDIETQKKYGLTELWIKNAQKEAEKFENNFDLIICSPFRRTQETAQEYLKTNPNAKLIIDNRLVDVNVWIYDEKPYSESKKFESNNDLININYPKWENYKDVEKRIIDVVNEYNNKNNWKNILILSHGGSLQVLMDSLKHWELRKHDWLIDKSKIIPLNNIQRTKYTYTSTWEEVDIHKHFVDEIFVKCPKTGEKLKRIPEVLDCWFESGSMPYASVWYMGEWEFKFPADFIAEWLDQTRGWFYTLIILSTALFDKPATQNTIVNWIVLAEDGKKMSKSLKNYPDPQLIFDKYGADAMRFYLMNSPVVEAQDLRFQESWVEEVVKKVILPLWNTYSFFTTYANIDKFEYDENSSDKKENPLDKWIVSETNKLVKEVKEGLDWYKINEATKNIPAFMDNLTNWYIRRSRKRFWKSDQDRDKDQAYNTLHEVLVTVSKVIAPFMPFVAENIYQNLSGGKSVHLTSFPEVNENLIDEELSASMDKTKKIINLGLAWRVNHKLKVRQPLKSVTIWEKLSDYYKNILKEELNVKEVIEINPTELAQKICKPNGRAIWPKFGKNVKDIMSAAKSWNFEELDNWTVKVWEFILEEWDFELVFQAWDSKYEIEAGFGMVIALDPELNEELKQEWVARDLVRAIQDARKEAEFNVEDRIEISISWENISEVLNNFWEYIENETLSKVNSDLENVNLEKEIEIWEEKIIIKLKK